MNKNKYILITFLSFLLFNAAAYSITDDFAEEYFADKIIERPDSNLDYNYESSEKIAIPLKPIKKTATGRNSAVKEGEKISFKVKKNIKYNDEIILKAGTIVTATVETFSLRGMNGVPASLVIDNFDIPGIENKKLSGAIIKKGISLTSLVLPLKWALTPIPFAGSTTNLILGGNAIISPDDNIKIYYYPER